ncbi:hypothetical protein DVH24_042272 [Malus domestica]|uniref:DNA-directed RNA polymerase RBP11-like dimerisation domain-containing protein n=1 Tax=Malus domestica TaxID=3750 RepID=A0A498J424_MALDO|nr:hypothetical protein DVH24_042272 [Malus domestica]
MNAPDRYERFVVPEGTKKVSYERDTKIINAASFTIEREDHTIGNILRMQLHRDENVLFAGYKLPHPLQYKIIVRIHTSSQSSPMQAYNQAINDLDKELDHLKSGFESLGVRLVRGTGRDEAFRPAFGAPKMGGTGCSTGQILGVFASHLPPGTGLFHVCGTQCFTILRQIYPMSFSKITPSFRPVPSRLRTKRTLGERGTSPCMCFQRIVLNFIAAQDIFFL